MAGTYGEPGKNTFAVAGISGILSPVVNDTTGVTQVYRQGAGNTFQSLGTYNPSTNKFTPDPNAGNLTQNEIKALSSEKGITTIKDSAKTTVSKGVQSAGGTPEAGQATSNKLLAPNNANNPDGTGDGSQLGPSGPPETGQNASGTKTSGFGDFKYPLDIASTKQDVIKFTMLEYKPSGVGASFGSAAGGSRGSLANGIPKDRKIAGTVVLPVPSGISDTNSADWGSNTMNALQAALAAGAYTGITEGLGRGVESVGSSLKTALGDDTTGRAIGAAFAGAAVGGDGAVILQRAEGAVVNPNMELLFNGPQLRPFTFTFKMSARNQSEAQEIIKILNFFKRGMSPIKTESNLFLKAPNTFKIQYLHLGSNGKDHPYIGRIKECALQNVTVNYTPEGQYATFRDGVMVSYEMQMQFQELEPVFNSDYEGLNGIGY